MKKGWKVFGIVSGAIFGIGVIFLAAGVVMGATLPTVRAFFTGSLLRFGQEKVTESVTMTDRDGGFSGIRSLEVDVDSMVVNIMNSEDERFYVETAEIDQRARLQVYQEQDELKIESEEDLRINHAGTITIYIPKGKMHDLEFSVGKGELTVDIIEVRADKADVSMEAGVADISGLEAYEISMECGAGTISASEITGSDIDIECGLGEAHVTVNGTKEEYNYSVECGIGSVQIADDSYAGIASEKEIYNGQSKDMSIECDMGVVTVEFEQ